MKKNSDWSTEALLVKEMVMTALAVAELALRPLWIRGDSFVPAGIAV